MIKRTFDIALSVIGIIIAAPVGFLVSIALKLGDRGPIFYRQARVGQNGRIFKILKFRTMCVDAETRGPGVTAAGDSRITRVGRILRKWKLDELPQLVNVLLGDMSFVGPRPETPEFVKLYTEQQRKVLALRPGITDLASLEFRNEEELLASVDDPQQFYREYCMPRKIEVNLKYADSASTFKDFFIIWGTVSLITQIERRIRVAVILLGYSSVLLAAFYVAYALRFDFSVPPDGLVDRNHYAPFVILTQLALLALFRQFRSFLSYFSIPDMLRIGVAIGSCNTALALIWYLSAGQMAPPRGVILADFVLASVGLGGIRVALRMYRERFAGTGGGQGDDIQPRRVVIIGAGDAGARLVKEAVSRPKLGLRPVCFLDDDKSKHNRQIHGVNVEGSPEILERLLGVEKVDAVVIAMPAAAGRRIQEIVRLATNANLKVEMVPYTTDLMSGQLQASRIREVEVEDMFGGEPVNLDTDGIRKSILDRVVLITGAGGSIGAELCRQLVSLSPKRLILVEQCEGNLFAIEQELSDRGIGALAVPLVADIQNAERMRTVFKQYKPNVVFHAAAHKHVFMLERQPAEAIRNNVFATRSLAALAVENGVERFILISTDKAFNPRSVMGATKRLAEIQVLAVAAGQSSGRVVSLSGMEPAGAMGAMQTREPAAEIDDKAREVPLPTMSFGNDSSGSGRAAQSQHTSFMCVRFGNVLGSSGSVIPTFRSQIAKGGPVTVTHPDAMRYFMSISEAVGLVLQASIVGKGGEIFTLDMGEPVKIADLARRMIEMNGLKIGVDIEIKYIGLKPGEKLHEELQHSTDRHAATAHPRVLQVTQTGVVSEAELAELQRQLYELDANSLKLRLKQLVPEYTPFIE